MTQTTFSRSSIAPQVLPVFLALLCLSVFPSQQLLIAEEIASGTAAAVEINWPPVTQSARPWTRWWWHGSAVDEANLTRLLEEYNAAGLGGVEITCIYGVRDNESRNREYLSDSWLQAVQHAIREAGRLGMGVDLPAGSGWRMGGPGVEMADANRKLVIEKTQVAGSETFSKAFHRAKPLVVTAVSEDGERVDLTKDLSNGKVEWQAPEGSTWTIYSMASTWAGDRVKRPAPGGAGLNINPFDRHSVLKYLTMFGEKLDQLPGIRAQFHDSFEYEGDWQTGFLEEFSQRRGYHLEDHLPELAGDGPSDLVARVKCDYRETLSDLVLDDLVKPWTDWAHDHNCLARDQAHGSPGNWLDLYAACDIPETESFGRLQGGDADLLILKFAAAAANVAGLGLVSSETATWLDEHFNVTLAQVKEIVDREFLAGVNHVFYHGTAYSPMDAPWPGWLFYASTQLNPQNPIWHDFPALNTYVTRCQSILQASKPDNDVLLYWPLHDTWHNKNKLRMDIRVHNAREWFTGHPFGDAARLLQVNGYSFDYVSDRGLEICQAGEGGEIEAPGGTYQAIVLPKARHMPLATLVKLNELANAGATVIFWGELPVSEPGLKGAQASKEWSNAISSMRESIDRKHAWTSDDLLQILRERRIRREQNLCDKGIDFLRRSWNGDTVYYLRNKNEESIDTWVLLSGNFDSAVILDPLTGEIGEAETRSSSSGGKEVHLQLAPGQTSFLRTLRSASAAEPWSYVELSEPTSEVSGPWQVEFITGGPVLPKSFETPQPISWTKAPDPDAQRFAGTVRYSTEFIVSKEHKRNQLNLGKVLGSARVSVDGVHKATLIAPPYTVVINNLQQGSHSLCVEVTGVAANRIRDLDRRGVEWRVFEDINLVNINYRPFDASSWKVRPMGLLGPVKLTPLKSKSHVH